MTLQSSAQTGMLPLLSMARYHESDLDFVKHYTEINFAAFAMVRVRFCPRLKKLHRQNSYCADPTRDHGPLAPVLNRGRRAVNFDRYR